MWNPLHYWSICKTYSLYSIMDQSATCYESFFKDTLCIREMSQFQTTKHGKHLIQYYCQHIWRPFYLHFRYLHPTISIFISSWSISSNLLLFIIDSLYYPTLAHEFQYLRNSIVSSSYFPCLSRVFNIHILHLMCYPYLDSHVYLHHRWIHFSSWCRTTLSSLFRWSIQIRIIFLH